MSPKLCTRIGLISGAAVGLIVQLLGASSCCGNPPATPTVLMCVLAGLIVSLIAVLLCAVFAGITLQLPVQPMLLLALAIGVPVGVVLGPVACHLPDPGLSIIVCGALGMLIAWLICRFLCRDFRWGGAP
jgi:hypothetical protein